MKEIEKLIVYKLPLKMRSNINCVVNVLSNCELLRNNETKK